MSDDLPQVHSGVPDHDPAETDSKDEAVFVGQQATGNTVVIGREDKEEWLVTEDMSPLDLEEVA